MRAYIVTLCYQGGRIRLPVLARSWAVASRLAIETVGQVPSGLSCRRVWS
jgi:hypothetical protein